MSYQHAAPSVRSFHLRLVAVAFLLAGFALTASAQPLPEDARRAGKKFEITPYASFFFTGDFDQAYYEFDFDDTEVDEGAGYGLLLGIGISRHVQLQFLYSSQETDLLIDEGGFFFDDRFVVPLDLEYLHAGLAYQWTPGQVHPFVDFSLGATRFDPLGAGFDSESRFSIAIGGGFKVFVSENLGFRFQGRIFSTFIGDDDEAFCVGGRVGNRFRDCFRRDDDTYMVQPELSAGLILAF